MQATSHGVAKSRAQLSDFTFFTFFLSTLLGQLGRSAGNDWLEVHHAACVVVHKWAHKSGLQAIK